MRIPNRLAVTGLAFSAATLMAIAAPATSKAGGHSTEPFSIKPITTPVTDPAAAPSLNPAPKTISGGFTPKQVELMAKSSDRTIAQQQTYLQEQSTQNNEYAALYQAGHRYDGAFFNKHNELVLQAPEGSPDAAAAKAAGITVRSPENGQAQLQAIANVISDNFRGTRGLAKVAPDIVTDSVVVTVTDQAAKHELERALADQQDNVRITVGRPYQTQALGGDALYMGQGRCSAGFPAHDQSGARMMVWAGHCVEAAGGGTISDEMGGLFGYAAATEFHSYDYYPDRDFGIVALADSAEMAPDLQDWGSWENLTADGGSWTPPVGTDTCKSGSTSGITCGYITGYGVSVTYSDDMGAPVADLSNLASSTVCTAAGDSGGAFVSQNYAIGMVSGGPGGQQCGWNSGSSWGAESFFQPLEDALSYYGLSYN